jgi:hypothetical protein
MPRPAPFPPNPAAPGPAATGPVATRPGAPGPGPGPAAAAGARAPGLSDPVAADPVVAGSLAGDPAPLHPALADPPPLCTLEEAPGRDAFRVAGTAVALWFQARGPVLFVTFDNLATLDEPAPRLPWMHGRIEALGHSILGVQAQAKDWYRPAESARMIGALREAGFFARFRRVIFLGASMGGFAALNLATLVPGARVLAFSPQSTMSQRIAPFEKRFGYAVRRSNWVDEPFLDAADAVPHLANAVILYDPFVAEDRAHAARLAAPGVTFLKAGHFTHQAIRFVIKCDALPQMLDEYAETGRIGPAFWRRLRARKGMRAWRRAFAETLAQGRHPRLALRALDAMLRDENYLFAHRARTALLARHPELAYPGLAHPGLAHPELAPSPAPRRKDMP